MGQGTSTSTQTDSWAEDLKEMAVQGMEQPKAWDVVDRPQPWAGTYDAVVAAAREAERQDSARRLRAWAASLAEPSAGLVALEAAEVVRGAR